MVDDWLENINESEFTGACLLDISKCYDSINHEILLKKLEMYEFQDVEPTWFKSYLHNRQLLVSFQQKTSEYLDIKKWRTARVSAGTHFDQHILKTCQNMNCFIHVLRRLRRIFPRGLLLKIYKSYIQSRLGYGLTIWGCTTDTNLGKIQRIQSLAARIITGSFDPIHSRGVDIVRPLHLPLKRGGITFYVFLCLNVYTV